MVALEKIVVPVFQQISLSPDSHLLQGRLRTVTLEGCVVAADVKSPFRSKEKSGICKEARGLPFNGGLLDFSVDDLTRAHNHIWTMVGCFKVLREAM